MSGSSRVPTIDHFILGAGTCGTSERFQEVRDRETKTPDAALTTAIVNGLRERRVLISATGFAANTLKIRPPLVFSEKDATRLITETEVVLAKLLK